MLAPSVSPRKTQLTQRGGHRSKCLGRTYSLHLLHPKPGKVPHLRCVAVGFWIQIYWNLLVPSGKLLHNYGQSPILMGKLTISMAFFNSYVTNYPPYHPARCTKEWYGCGHAVLMCSFEAGLQPPVDKVSESTIVYVGMS